MESSNLDAGIRSLWQSMRHIESLLAWSQLRQSEMNLEQSLGFRVHDSTEDDLRGEYSYFMATALDLRNILHRYASSIEQSERERIMRWLTRAEKRLQDLNLGQRIRSL